MVISCNIFFFLTKDFCNVSSDRQVTAIRDIDSFSNPVGGGGHTLPTGLNRVNFSICDRMLRFTCGLRNN